MVVCIKEPAALKLWQSLSWVNKGEYSGMLSSHIPGEVSLLALLTRVFIATIGATSSVSVARIGGEGGEALAGVEFVSRSHSVCAKVLLSVALIANDGWDRIVRIIPALQVVV